VSKVHGTAQPRNSDVVVKRACTVSGGKGPGVVTQLVKVGCNLQLQAVELPSDTRGSFSGFLMAVVVMVMMVGSALTEHNSGTCVPHVRYRHEQLADPVPSAHHLCLDAKHATAKDRGANRMHVTIVRGDLGACFAALLQTPFCKAVPWLERYALSLNWCTSEVEAETCVLPLELHMASSHIQSIHSLSAQLLENKSRRGNRGGAQRHKRPTNNSCCVEVAFTRCTRV